MGESGDRAPIRFLIINPNTSQSMTDALKPMVQGLGYYPTEFTYFTCPTPGVPSINSPDDAAESAKLCLPHLVPLIPHHDAFLVACYSQHPLVHLLKTECSKLSAGATKGEGGSGAHKYVTGIYEASVTTSLSLIADDQSFGIVSTGKIWEKALKSAVHDFVGTGDLGSNKFAGCETTGLNATELHDLPAEEVKAKMTEATKRLVLAGQKEGNRPVHSICLGCAGMVGLDDAVRQGCIEVLGPEEGKQVRIVDGVKAGVGSLFALATSGF